MEYIQLSFNHIGASFDSMKLYFLLFSNHFLSELVIDVLFIQSATYQFLIQHYSLPNQADTLVHHTHLLNDQHDSLSSSSWNFDNLMHPGATTLTGKQN